MKKIFCFSLLINILFVSLAIAQTPDLESGKVPKSACECYERAYLHGKYNYTPKNNPITQDLHFMCELFGWQQSFFEGNIEGLKDYKISIGDYSEGPGQALCSYAVR